MLMANFVVFNELSLPLKDHDWRSQLKTYLDVTKHLQQCGISSIRIQQHFRDLPFFTESQSLQAFFGGLPRDMQSRLRSLLTNQTNIYQSPLITEQEPEQYNELTINSEYYYQGEVNTGGLACADIFNTLVISFLTNQQWSEPAIELQKSHVESENEKTVVVDHVGNMAHCQHHRATIDALQYIPQTIDELLAFCHTTNDKYPFDIQFTDQAQAQLVELVNQGKELLTKTYQIVQSLKKTPTEGLGKPEHLRENLSGWMSRRITQEHRLVYRQITENRIEVSRCIGHYS